MPEFCQSNHAASQRLAHRFGLGMDVQLFVDAAHVVPDGVQADVHLAGRGLIAVPLGQQGQNPLFLHG